VGSLLTVLVNVADVREGDASGRGGDFGTRRGAMYDDTGRASGTLPNRRFLLTSSWTEWENLVGNP